MNEAMRADSKRRTVGTLERGARRARLRHSLLGLLLAGLVAGGLAACSGLVNSDATEGSQTHFLARCIGECGPGLECICGVCTQRCFELGECSMLAEGASCIVSAASCAAGPASCGVECTGDADCQGLGAGFECALGQCRALTLSLSLADAKVGDVCVAPEESHPLFSGFALEEVYVSDDVCADGNPCVVNHFQGRVTCPGGQTGEPGDPTCLTPEGVPVDVRVRPNLPDRLPEVASICSCRCAGPDRANYCSCPRGMRCEELIPPSPVLSEEPGLIGSYCVY
jgi:hypothetical protein